MGATLAGETRAEGDEGEGGGKADRAAGGAEPAPEPLPSQHDSTSKKTEKSKKESQEESPPRQPDQPDQPDPQDQNQKQKQQHNPQPKHLSRESVKLVRRRSTEDIQRMQTEAIVAEFDRLLLQAEGQLKEVVESSCADVAARLQSCLQAHRQRSCNCFPAMEQYRNCVLRATQNRVDDLADREPPILPVVPPQSIPRPEVPPPNQRSNRRWWKFWTWFR